MNTGTVNMSQSSTRPERGGSEWVSRWERELAWDATFGNRGRLPWPYRTTSLRCVLGDEPNLGRQLADAFAELREPFNAITHLVGVFLALVAVVVMTTAAGIYGGALHVLCAAAFGGSLLVAYLASALHHSLRAAGWIEQALARADRSATYLLLAGPVVPVFLIGVGGVHGALWLTAGALFYALAAIVGRSRTSSLPWRLDGHNVAHLLVIAGSACQVWAVTRYCLPLA